MNIRKMNMTEEKDTGTKSEYNNSEDEIFIDNEAEEIDFNKLGTDEDLAPELKSLIDSIVNNTEMDEQIEDLFEDLDSNGLIDIKKSKGKLLLLLQSYLSRVANINKEQSKKILAKIEREINHHIDDLNHHFVHQKESIQNTNRGFLSNLKERFASVNTKSKEDLKNVIKRFAIYEAYQVINPKRIAGESRLDNFVHNMILGGFKRASKYVGGRPKDLQNYNKNFILKLEKLHNQLFRAKEDIEIDNITPSHTPLGASRSISKERGRSL